MQKPSARRQGRVLSQISVMLLSRFSPIAIGTIGNGAHSYCGHRKHDAALRTLYSHARAVSIRRRRQIGLFARRQIGV
jgi:hypothetical protein